MCVDVALRSAHTGTKPLVCTAWDTCCSDSTQAVAHEADKGIGVTEITKGTREQALKLCFYWFMSVLLQGQFAKAVHVKGH